MTDQAARQIKNLVEQQGRSVTWLANQMEMSYSHVWRVLTGLAPATDVFVDKALEVLGTARTVTVVRDDLVLRIPRPVFDAEVDEDLAADAYENAWKKAWVDIHGPTTLATAAERAFRAHEAGL